MLSSKDGKDSHKRDHGRHGAQASTAQHIAGHAASNSYAQRHRCLGSIITPPQRESDQASKNCNG